MKITDLRIGDRVQNKTSKFPMTVIDIISDFSLPINPNKGTVYLDFDGNEGDVWEENVEDLEFCEPRYKFPEWKNINKDMGYIIKAIINLGALSIGYEIDVCKNYSHTLYLLINSSSTNYEEIGEYSTIEEAKTAAEKHYNELVSELIEKLTFGHLTNEASKTQHND